MKKTLLLALSALSLLAAFNYAAAPSYAKNEDAVITLVKEGKTSQIKFGELEKHFKYGFAEKLIKIILANKEQLIPKPAYNPEIDATDKESMLREGKTISNQTTYLRKAGIDPEKTALENSSEVSINDTLKSSRMVYYTSLIDLDSDGTNEIRFHSTQGTAREEDNYFFKKDEKSGKYRLIENCDLGGGSDMVIFVKYKNVNYTIERNNDDIVSRLKVYLFNGREEKFEPLFTINIDRSGSEGKSITLTLDSGDKKDKNKDMEKDKNNISGTKK